MKTCNNVVSSSLVRWKSECGSRAERWRKHYSSLQAAVTEGNESWDVPVALPPRWWCSNRSDKRSFECSDLNNNTEGAFWCDKQRWVRGLSPPTKSSLRSGALLHPGCFRGVECEDLGRSAAHSETQFEAWRRLSEEGELAEATDALSLLVEHKAFVSRTIFYRLLKKCVSQKDLVVGRRLHALAVKHGYGTNKFLANHIIRMYASHGRLEEASLVFRIISLPDTHMWCSLITGYLEDGQALQAIALYLQMRDSLVKPDNFTFVAVLKACERANDLSSGKVVHADVLGTAAVLDVHVGNSLVAMYAKCGNVLDACQVFNNMPRKNVGSWYTIIAGYVQHGLSHEALALYASMRSSGMALPCEKTFICLLQACAGARFFHQGKELEAQLCERGMESNLVIGNCLVDMYAKCGSMRDAHRVFETLPAKDVVTWTVMIAGYSHLGMGEEALTVYAKMRLEGNTAPDHFTFACLLKACASIDALQEGKKLHAEIQDRGLERDVVVGSCLVDMYGKCGRVENARKVFDNLPAKNVVTWNCMIGGYMQHGLSLEALSLYEEMQKDGKVRPDDVTFLILLKACASIGSLQKGKLLHGHIERRRLGGELVIGNGLVDMYVKCGSLDDARAVFNQLPTRNVVTWTAMIVGYVQHGLCQDALNVYAIMQEEGITLSNHYTLSCLLKACASVGALHLGKQLHLQILDRNLVAHEVVGNCLVDMYAKCGSLEEARRVFHGLPAKNVVTWNALLNGYAQNSHGLLALQCYSEMQLQNVEPNAATFICLLTACSHQGLVSEGRKFFKAMVEDYGIVPSVHHFTCMVDLLGRSGHLDEAENMLHSMPYKNDVVAWTSLLSACRSHGDVERGRRCFDHLVKLEPQTATAYVLLADIYAHARRWKDADKIEGMRKHYGACKSPAIACIELRNNVHTFSVGQQRHDISSKLRSVNLLVDDAGVLRAHTSSSISAAPASQRGDALCGHAEKLALAYGLLNTSDGTTLLVTKNLRMCSDCHTGTKVLSRVEKREIIVRDGHCVHRFVDGCCSCGDRN